MTRPKFSLNTQILIAMVLGIGTGITLSQYSDSSIHPHAMFVASILGESFVNLLKMILIPLVFSSIVTGIGNLRQHQQMGKIWKLTLAYFLSTTALAILLGLILVNLFEPGKSISIDMFRESLSSPASLQQMNIQDWFHQFLTQNFQNPLQAMASNQILPTLVFAIFFGIALILGGKRGDRIFTLMDDLFHLVMLMVTWIMKFAPYGIFGLLIKLMADAKQDLFANLGVFIGVVIFGTLFHALITLPFILRWITGMNQITFLKGIWPALINAFSTCSSSATLPVTMQCVEKNLKGNPHIAGFVLPLGATVNMDGTAIYEAMAAMFIANLSGIELSLIQQMVVFLTSIIAAMGAPGIPSAGMVTMMMVLQSVGLPVEAIAILLPMDRFLDAFRTATNVLGDSAGCLIVDRLTSPNKTNE